MIGCDGSRRRVFLSFLLLLLLFLPLFPPSILVTEDGQWFSLSQAICFPETDPNSILSFNHSSRSRTRLKRSPLGRDRHRLQTKSKLWQITLFGSRSLDSWIETWFGCRSYQVRLSIEQLFIRHSSFALTYYKLPVLIKKRNRQCDKKDRFHPSNDFKWSDEVKKTSDCRFVLLFR